MPGPTGLIEFRDCYPERFFDVGIAEQHAVNAAAGPSPAAWRRSRSASEWATRIWTLLVGLSSWMCRNLLWIHGSPDVLPVWESAQQQYIRSHGRKSWAGGRLGLLRPVNNRSRSVRSRVGRR